MRLLYRLRPNTVFENRVKGERRKAPLTEVAPLVLPHPTLYSPTSANIGKCTPTRQRAKLRSCRPRHGLATQCSRALRVLYSCTHARHAFRAFALLHSCHRCGCSHIFHRLLSCTFRGSLQAWPRAVRAGALVILHVVGHACASLQWRTTTSTVMECLTGAPAF